MTAPGHARGTQGWLVADALCILRQYNRRLVRRASAPDAPGTRMPGPIDLQSATRIDRTATGVVDPARYQRALMLLASLFFIWGFITVINNTLLPHLRSVSALSYTQTTLLESVWFIAYFFASMPSAWLI